MCRLCKQKTESNAQLVSSCSVLTPIEYKESHDKTGHDIHWNVCIYYGILDCEKWSKCNIMAEGFRFMPLGLVTLRTFQLSAWVT